MLNERHLKVCAIALFADGFSKEQIAKVLEVKEYRAQALIEKGAEEQSSGKMGHMKNCPAGKNRVVVRRHDDGGVAKTRERVPPLKA